MTEPPPQLPSAHPLVQSEHPLVYSEHPQLEKHSYDSSKNHKKLLADRGNGYDDDEEDHGYDRDNDDRGNHDGNRQRGTGVDADQSKGDQRNERRK